MSAPSATGSARTPDAVRTHWWQKVPQLLPGIVVSFIGAGLAWGIAQLVPGLSTLLVAILLAVIALVLVAIVFAALLTAGPPTEWFD